MVRRGGLYGRSSDAGHRPRLAVSAGNGSFERIWHRVKEVPIARCAACETEIPYHVERCIGCGGDVGFPNVRAANQEDEVRALHERLRYAQVAAAQRGCAAELEAFGTAAAEAQAVMVRTLPFLDGLVSQQQSAMVSYYKMVRAGARLPENNEFDMNRGRIDATINPFNVHEEIQFAALSLDGRGVPWYGDYSLTLRDTMIGKRSSVFEENPFRFCDKHPIPTTGSVPSGYRASWARRGELAMAKLHPRISQGMTDADFPAVLLEQGGKSADSDFVEVHIYGAIHARAVERVIGPVPKRRADRIIWNRVKRSLDALGAQVEEV